MATGLRRIDNATRAVRVFSVTTLMVDKDVALILTCVMDAAKFVPVTVTVNGV